MAGTGIQALGRTGASAGTADIVSTVSRGSSDFRKAMTGAMYSNIGSSVNNDKSMTSNRNNLNVTSQVCKTTKSDTKSKDTYKNIQTDSTDKASISKDTDKNVKSSTSSSLSNISDKSSKVNQAVQDIKNSIKVELDISDDKLEEVMSILGLTNADLLQSQNIADIFMEVTGTQDAMDIITDAALTQSFQNIISTVEQTVDNLSEDTGMSIEQLKDFINADIADEKNYTMSDNVKTEEVVQTDVADKMTGDNEEADSVNEDTLDNISQSVEKKITIQSDNKSSDNMKGYNGSDKSSDVKTTVSEISSNLVQSIQNSFEEVMNTTTTQTVNGVDVIKQIINSVKVTGNNVVQSMEIQLNPEHLGKVTLNVTSKSGVITAEIVAQNEQVKKAIESQINTLKDNFENQGIKIEAVEVTVQSHSFESGQNLKGNDSEQGKRSKGTRKAVRLEDFEEMSEESDELIDNLIQNENSSVEYTA